MEMLRIVKKPFHKFIISFDDPVFKYEYNQLYLNDREYKKRFYSELKVCRHYMKKKARLCIDEKFLKIKQALYQRKADVKTFTSKGNGSKKHTKKSKWIK